MQFDLFFEVMVPEPWDSSKEQQRFRETIEQVTLADQGGFTTAWLARHHGAAGFAHNPAPEIIFGALAERTQNIRFGLGVELLPLDHPIRVAERAAVLDIISGGRVDVGTGRTSAARQNDIFQVDPATSRDRWEEAIRLLPKLWTQTEVSHAGQFWSWEYPLTVVPRPVQQPHPPLWAAASQSSTCGLIGDKGIGLMMSALKAPEALKEEVSSYRAAIQSPTDQIGLEKNDQITVMIVGGVHADGARDQAERSLTAATGYIDRTRTHLSKNEARHPTLALLTDADLLEQGLVLVGDRHYMVDALAPYEELGVDRVMFILQLEDLPHQDVMQSLEIFATEVIPKYSQAVA